MVHNGFRSSTVVPMFRLDCKVRVPAASQEFRAEAGQRLPSGGEPEAEPHGTHLGPPARSPFSHRFFWVGRVPLLK